MSTSTTNDLKFSVLVSLFNAIKAGKNQNAKKFKFRKFLDTYCKPCDYFSAIRLILPTLDRERGSYHLKEAVLATTLVDALAMSRDSDDAKKLINWRRGGSAVAGDVAGNFAAVAGEVLSRRQSSVSGGVTVGEVNGMLDRLAAAPGEGKGREEKVRVMAEMIKKTSAAEMRWLVMIVLKELKLGLSEKSVFNEFHPDAEDLFNVTCDLRFVCEKLCDRGVRHKRKDIEVGKPVRPQLADRGRDCGAAWKRLHGKELVAECKFDGDRIQVHKNGSNVNYFSRNFINHDEYEAGMNGVIIDNVDSERCILDGEMLVWDKEINRFDVFGGNREVAKAAKEGLTGNRDLCYVAFDILYVGDTSVIHQTLKERQELLRKVVRPVKGKLEVLLPSGNEGLNSRRASGDPCWSIVVKHAEEVERFFKELIDNREEGIVLKDLGSKWEPGDRNGKWLKVKPDYVNAGSDLDVLIIGGYYGSGRRGGEIGQFLLGLAERPSPNTYPRRFMSFCKVGTGLSDGELNELVTKLKPYFRKYEYPKKSPPSFYQVTNNSKERPDVWVESPEKSFIVSISSDIRTIDTDTFAAPYGLRFPRISRVRYDKPWHECLDVQSFLDLVQSSNGTTQRGWGDNVGVAVGTRKRSKTAKAEGRKKLSFSVPSHFVRTDVSSVKGESRIFSNMVFHFVNVPAGHSSDSMHTLIVENGGTFSMNLNDTVTHCVGAQSKGIKYEAVKRRGRDVIHYSWVLECCSRKQLLPLRPNHFVYLSDASRKKLQEEIDEFSDSYFWDINVAELKQILHDVSVSKDAKVDYYKKKYCPREKWCYFHGCRVYLHLVDKFPSSDWGVFLRVATRRMKVEVSTGGGKVVENPSEATHIVVVSLPEHELKFETLLQSFPEDKKRLLRLKRVHVVESRWLEDCFEKGKKLPEVVYSLKLDTMEESSSSGEEGENDINMEKLLDSAVLNEPVPSKAPPMSVAHTREPRRKRGRPALSKQPPKPRRARVGKRPAKLQEIASDDETSEKELEVKRPKRTRVGKRPAKLQEIASDDEPSEKKLEVKRPKRVRGVKGAVRLLDITSDDETSEKDHVQPRPSPQLIRDVHVSLESDHDDNSSAQEANILAKDGPKNVSDLLESESLTLERNKELRGEEPYFRHDEINHSLDNAGLVRCNRTDKDTELSTSGKLEASIDDPVQAMLLNLLPSLGKTVEAPKPVVEDKSVHPKAPKEGSTEVPKGEPVKKKKVSYRDLVDQLLKD